MRHMHLASGAAATLNNHLAGKLPAQEVARGNHFDDISGITVILFRENLRCVMQQAPLLCVCVKNTSHVHIPTPQPSL